MSDQPFPHDEWLRVWQDTTPEKIGKTHGELVELWGISGGAVVKRRNTLIRAGKLRCTWAPRQNVNGVFRLTTVYVLVDAGEAKQAP